MNPFQFDITKVVNAAGLKAMSATDGELRFRNKGSLKVDTDKNTFYDFETNESGGCYDFIVHQGFAKDRHEAIEWASQNGVTHCENFSHPKLLREHVYEDQYGKEVPKAIKYPDGSWKQMRFEHGDWKYGVKDVPNIPYGLPRLIEDYSNNVQYLTVH